MVRVCLVDIASCVSFVLIIRWILIASMYSTTADVEESDDDVEKQRQMLSRLAWTSTMSGQELRDLVLDKWNRAYDVRLQKRGERMYLHVMWYVLGY